MVKLNLEDTGEYEVRTETKGTRVLGVAQEFKPDLILLDIVMPDLDGGEVAHRIKSDENLKDISIVFLTAIATQDEVASHDGIIGGHPFIAKPATTEELVECIEKNIRK